MKGNERNRGRNEQMKYIKERKKKEGRSERRKNEHSL
jgi:hypothetical protein